MTEAGSNRDNKETNGEEKYGNVAEQQNNN